MTSHEAIGWMRICRPGSVIGHQQTWLEQLEPWLIKQGNIYRRHACHDPDKLPYHEFGIYSIAEQSKKQRPVVIQKPPSPPPPLQKIRHSDAGSPARPQNSRIKEAINKAAEKEYDWRMKWKTLSSNQKIPFRAGSRYQLESQNTKTQRTSGAGDPKAGRPIPQSSTSPSHDTGQCTASQQFCKEPAVPESMRPGHAPVTTFRTSHAPLIKSVTDAKNYLMRSSIHNRERDKQLNTSITVTSPPRTLNNMASSPGNVNVSTTAKPTPALKMPTSQPYRRRLGRSPSPPPRLTLEQNRATNTPSATDKVTSKNISRGSLKDIVTRLKSGTCAGSLGAGSLGANRDAPAPRMTSSVRSDERPLATQGDMLNSIKFERRFREAMHSDRPGMYDKTWKLSNIKTASSRTNNMNTKINSFNERSSNVNKPSLTANTSPVSSDSDKTRARSFFSPSRPVSPKGRRNQQTSSFY